AVYIAIGIKPNGHKEVIDYRIAPSENVENWTEMLQDMKSRGLELFLSDGVVGMKEAICQSYPKAHFQRCLVHVMCNISAKMRVDDRQKALDEFKQIHTQSNKEMAVQVLHEFYQNW
ncbi:transposase, partial [Lactobacillus amylovorus]|uniref:transposase n=1 Tax=Lactobacillus amylovorus TaxID=1604 RepID=UPI00313D13DE